MFMFVFAVVLISIVGLFLQVINALVLFFASQQMAMGQQLFAWHEMARQYACDAGTPQSGIVGTSDTNVVAGIRSMRDSYAGNIWDTVIFDGSYEGTPARLVLSYIASDGNYAGYSPAEVARQFRKSQFSTEYRFSPVYSNGADNAMNIVISSAGTNYNIVISGIPTTGPDAVPTGVVGAVSSLDCSP